MASKPLTSNPKKIVVIGKKLSASCLRRSADWRNIGGGIIGCSTAYYLTRHALYNPKVDSIVLLEASRIAGGASGKGGGFIANWATPKSLAPLSFKLHNQLAKEYDGAKVWGHRNVYAAEVKLQGRNLPDNQLIAGDSSHLNAKFPSALDWLLPGSIQKYDEIGTPSNSGQVNPLMFTTTLAQLAEGKGTKIILGSASQINYEGDTVSSVTYIRDNETHTIMATDVIVAAGPWTPKLLPKVRLLTPRGHSVIVKPSRALSPYILFPNIEPAPNSTFKNLISPDIYPRPPDQVHEFDTVYSSGPDSYEVPLPADTDSVKVDEEKCSEVWTAISSVSQEIHDGKVIAKQACYKPQIRKHEETEEVGPMVGPMGPKGLWIATGHDEWGIQNAPATGLVLSEMIFDGRVHSADCEGLDPKHLLSNLS